MIPKEFNYVAPGSLAEALKALGEGGEDAKVLAGGHSLIPALKLRLSEPTLLVDLRKVGELRGIRVANGHIHIGAMTTYHEANTSRELQEGCSLLCECAYSIGDAQVRARGTLGGSLVHADPAADLPAAIIALDATLMVTGGGGEGGEREIAARDFFQGLFTTALEPGEILTGIRVPRMEGRTGAAYVKVRNKASHYALVGAAAVVTLDGDSVSKVSIGITGAAASPFRLEGVENALRGKKLDADSIREATEEAGDMDVEWMSDLFGSEEYRRHLVGVTAARALETALSRAQ